MSKDHEWMPTTLFDMAAFCEANGLDKAGALLIETAVMLHIYLSRREQVGEADVRLRAESAPHPAVPAAISAAVVPFPLLRRAARP